MAPDMRMCWISIYRCKISASRRRGTNSSGEMQKRRMSARSVDITATWGTWLILLIHFMVSSVLHRKCGFSCACSMRICARLSARWFSNSACWLCRRATTMVLNCCANSPNSSCRPAGTGTCTSRLFFPTCRMA